MVQDLPIAGGQLRLSMTVATAPLSANEILLTLLPILMWVAGAAIGWLVVDRLILRPLASIQAAIERYRLVGRFEMPPLTTPAVEIRTLSRAFARAATTITRHEIDLEDGLARQTRLTREVHHRVKNNLQVVASLLNIHARSAPTPEASDAYATIQRRVDALALVHRSHYAELEVNHGIALRPLIGELASNLRGSLPRDPALARHHDRRRHAPGQSGRRRLRRVPAGRADRNGDDACPRHQHRDQPGRRSPTRRAAHGWSRDPPRSTPTPPPSTSHFEQFERVVAGLARQLRSPLERDPAQGLYAIEIAVMGEQPHA